MSGLLQKKSVFAFALLLCAIGVALAWPDSAPAQRVRFGDSYVIPQGQTAPPGTLVPGAPQTTLPVISAPPIQSGTPLPGTVQTVPAVPLQTTPGIVVPQGITTQPYALQQPPPGAVILPNTGLGPQSIQPPQYIYPPPGTVQNIPVVPGSTSNGSWSNSPFAWPSEAWARLRGSSYYRFVERPRWRQTFIYRGSGAASLGLNETDLATTFAFPNFLYTGQPIRISPGFIFHWWDGPSTPATGADLPPRTYSAYLASDITTPWNRQFGGELNFTVGVYSDFNFVNSNSIRFTGVGLGWFRLNNTTTFKLGIEYLDRVDVKLLPALGFFIYPRPDLKLDIYFPRPRLAMRFPSSGYYETWGYIGGEYGTGSWTIERIGGARDQVDVNDVRIFLGLEWLGPRRVSGLFEVGYLFNRNMVYRSASHIETPIDGSWMLRAGIAF